jgi:hypothetical protein
MKKKPLGLKINPELWERFTKHVEYVGYDRTKLFKKILENFLQKNTKKE